MDVLFLALLWLINHFADDHRTREAFDERPEDRGEGAEGAHVILDSREAQ